MAEFAALASVLFMLTFGTMEMSVVVYRYNTLCTAARESMRYAIVHSPTSANPASTSQIQQVATNYAPFLVASNVIVTWPADPSLPSQSDARVQISYNYRITVPFMSAVNVTLSSASQMLVSQ